MRFFADGGTDSAANSGDVEDEQLSNATMLAPPLSMD